MLLLGILRLLWSLFDLGPGSTNSINSTIRAEKFQGRAGKLNGNRNHGSCAHDAWGECLVIGLCVTCTLLSVAALLLLYNKYKYLYKENRDRTGEPKLMESCRERASIFPELSR